MRELVITDNEAGQRLNKYLMKYLNKAPSGFVYKMLRKKNIKLNDAKVTGSEMIYKGDVVKLFMSDETIANFRDEKAFGRVSHASGNFRLDVIYRDADILIADKPAGVLSQKASPSDYSLNDALISYLLEKDIMTEEDMSMFKPSICNRLDRNTSGIILCGISLKGSQELSRMLKERRIDKYYLTIVKGHVKKEMRCSAFLLKDEKTNKVKVYEELPQDSSEKKIEKIITEYTPLKTNGSYTLLRVKLITGKTHQIRAHLAYMGYPVAGDRKYGDEAANISLAKKYGLKNHLLHCARVVFPKDGMSLSEDLKGREFTAFLPDTFKRIEKDLFE